MLFGVLYLIFRVDLTLAKVQAQSKKRGRLPEYKAVTVFNFGA
jgi:hypothetical protein